MHVTPRSRHRRRTLAAALGLNSRLAIVGPASGPARADAGKGFYKYKVGSVEVTALYDGIWKKPHDPAFIKNASVEDTKAALAKAGMTTDYMPIPLTVDRLEGRATNSSWSIPARALANGSRLPSVSPAT